MLDMADMCRLRSEKEARKYMQRRKKRKREKAAEGAEAAAEQPAAEHDQDGADTSVAASDLLAPMQVLLAFLLSRRVAHVLFPLLCVPLRGCSTHLSKLLAQVLRAKQKVKAFAFAPRPSKGSVATCTLALGNNSIEVRYAFGWLSLLCASPAYPQAQLDATHGGVRVVTRRHCACCAQTWEVAEEAAVRARGIEAPGHRAGPRALALSSDDGLLLSAAAGAAKLWNLRSGACVRTIETGQARDCNSLLEADVK